MCLVVRHSRRIFVGGGNWLKQVRRKRSKKRFDLIGPVEQLPGSNPLNAEWVASRPFHFVFGLTVRVNRDSFCFLAQAGGSNEAHSPSTVLATKNLLQLSPFA